MGKRDYDMEMIPAPVAARALGIPVRTMQFWLTKGEIAGEQTITGRWYVRVGDVRALIQRRAKDGGKTEERFEVNLAEHFRADKGEDGKGEYQDAS